jgi:tetratricopeptide (TPR) repeat protein
MWLPGLTQHRFEIHAIRCQTESRFEAFRGGRRLSAELKVAPAVYARIEAVDVRSLPLDPEEAFVLSRVDGKSHEEAIASTTGLPPDRVVVHLRRLEALGAIQNPASPTTSAQKGQWSAELDESLSIGIDLQIRILELTARLPEMDHFELLGVELGADRSVVKRAYFAMIGTFHPDTYYGKRLGAFTKRMEKIFQRLTEAHDVLSNHEAREAYDAYLTALGRTRRIEEVVAAPPPSVEDLEQLLMQAEQAVKAREEAVEAAPPPLPRLPPPLPRAQPSRRPVQMVDDPAARRQGLARKLGLTVVAAPSSPPAGPTHEAIRDQAARRSAAVKDLHQRYQHRKGAIRDQRLERFAAAAEEALAAGNTVSALNTLKIARSLAGGDVGTVQRLEELEKQVGATVADSYLERARYEETNGQYEEAARSYTRAARGRLSSDVLKSAAECYLKAGVELRLAGDLAREAVQIAPDRTDLRVTLAKIYEAAGMQQNAIRELERALELTPDSDRIKQWLKRIKRGGV